MRSSRRTPVLFKTVCLAASALLSFAYGGSAIADETTAQAGQKFGLLGTWAEGCSKPASLHAVYSKFAVQDGKLISQADGGAEAAAQHVVIRAIEIESTQTLSPTQIILTEQAPIVIYPPLVAQDTGKSAGPATVILTEEKNDQGQIRVLDLTLSGNGWSFEQIKDGFSRDFNEKQLGATPWRTRCHD